MYPFCHLYQLYFLIFTVENDQTMIKPTINHLLVAIVFSLSVLLLSNCDTAKPTQNPPPDPPVQEQPTVMKDRIMTLLGPRMIGKNIEQKFSTYEVKSLGQMSRSENRWLFTYNEMLIKPEELLQLFQESDLILEAEFMPTKEAN